MKRALVASRASACRCSTSLIVCVVVLACAANSNAGPSVSHAQSWPAPSEINHNPAAFNLLVFLNPRCQCSNGAMKKITEIVSDTPEPLELSVLLFSTATKSPEIFGSESSRPGSGTIKTATYTDQDGTEAALFGVQNSGHCLLYGPDKHLLYSGGLRGEGALALGKILNGIPVEQTHFSVSGCAFTYGPALASYDFFTNFGRYMPRVQCLQTASGNPDWLWISMLIGLHVAVLLGYLRVFVFWQRCYKSQNRADRDEKLMQLAWVFFICGFTGYGMFIVMFFWPAYRLLAIGMMALVFVTWRFALDLKPFEKSITSQREQRKLNAALAAEKGVLMRQTRDLELAHEELADANKVAENLALVAKYTDNAVVITNDRAEIEWVNDGFTRITEYTLDEVVGRAPGAFLHGEKTDQQTVAYMRSKIQQQEGFDVEIINYSKSGKEYWLAIEARPIRDETGRVVKFIAIESDITDRKNAESEREQLSLELRNAARHAGMAEVATGILHNVGNVLNSVNVSANVLTEKLTDSDVKDLAKAAAIIDDHADDLATFMTSDARGKHFPNFLGTLANHLMDERESACEELRSLVKNVQHIKEIVSVQQSYAKVSGTTETIVLSEVLEDALKTDEASLIGHNVEIVRDYEQQPTLSTDKHKLLQILVNLISNANQALVASNQEDKRLTLHIGHADDNCVKVEVRDNGVGIADENLIRIFSHGFTTKKNGHGFGLHSSSLAAKEIGGSLAVHSDGPGQGAVFTLELPVRVEEGTLCGV